MTLHSKKPTQQDLAAMHRRRMEAMHLQEIEGNPLDSEQVSMFDMFDRDEWTDEQIKAHLDARAKRRSDFSNR
jgi:hypothetical protein